MPIPTSRTKENARIRIDADNCIGCGMCVAVCKDFGLTLADGKAVAGGASVFGCIGCGHCMAVCPHEAITIHGRTLSPGDMFDLPAPGHSANYDQLLALFQRRRSIREFTDRNVEPEIVEKILRAAVASPMGLPPSDVNILIFDTKEKNRGFAEDFCVYLKSIKWIVSGWFLTLMRPFWGKAGDELFREFVRPCFNVYIGEMEKGVNLITTRRWQYISTARLMLTLPTL